jgi:hypothetical protein
MLCLGCLQGLLALSGAKRDPRLSAAETNGALELIFNVRTFGAVGDGTHLDTAAMQAAVDACSKAGGGVVLVPPGKYLIGTLFLKSNTNLHLTATAVLFGTSDLTQYATGIERCGFTAHSYIDKCLIHAAKADNVKVSGQGTIDGQGSAFPATGPDGKAGERPMLIRLADCTNVAIEGVTLRNAGSWCSHFVRCSHLRIRGVTILNRCNGNNDGIDITGSENVLISDCTILAEDDGICLQNLDDVRPVKNVLITNCIISTRWAAIRSGGAHAGGIRDVTVSNCSFFDTFGCGIKLQVNGAGAMENMTFSNIVMKNVSSPISLRLGRHNYGEKIDMSGPPGGMRNLMFNNIRADVIDEAGLRKSLAEIYHVGPYPGEERQCISIMGIPGFPIQGVTLSNIQVTFPGGGTREDAAKREMPELEDVYPEYFLWGVLPAYGLYARHVEGLSLDAVRFDLAAPDLRPAVVCDMAKGVDISGLRAQGSLEVESLIRLRSTRDAFLYGCRPLGEIGTFLRVEGNSSGDIALQANDLHRAKTVFETAEAATEQAVITAAK